MIKQMQKLSIALILLSAGALQGCTSMTADSASMSTSSRMMMAGTGMGMAAESSAALPMADQRAAKQYASVDSMGGGGNNAGSADAAITARAQARKMIMDYNYLISVKNVKKSCLQIENDVKDFNGYLLSMSPEVVVVRMPIADCDLFRNRLNDLGRIVREESTGRDVTAEMVDIELRLGNFKSLRERLVELSKQTGKVEELLKVEKELARVTGEIEQLEGMLKFYSERTDYATFTLRLQEEYTDSQQDVQVLTVPFLSFYGYNPSGYLYGNGKDNAPFDITLPENLLVVNSGTTGVINFMEAVGADHSGVRLSKFKNLAGGTQSFWNELFAKTLKDVFKYSDSTFESVTIGEGRTAGKLTAANGKYTLYVVTDQDDFMTFGNGTVYCIEVQNEGGITGDSIEKMLQSIDLSMWR